jgi:hypothetical protein
MCPPALIVKLRGEVFLIDFAEIWIFAISKVAGIKMGGVFG